MSRIISLFERILGADVAGNRSAWAETPCEASARIDLELSDREEMRSRSRRDSGFTAWC